MHLANYAKMSRDLVEVRGICSRTRKSGDALASESRLAFVTDDYASLLARDDIDVVDICVPAALHHDFTIRAADAGKHTIMEKPLTGYFGAEGDPEPIGTRVPRALMREGARNNAEAVREGVRRNGVKFCYAENWIYAAPIEKMRRLIAASKGSILELRAEENHSGSNSAFSRDWKSTEGCFWFRISTVMPFARLSEGFTITWSVTDNPCEISNLSPRLRPIAILRISTFPSALTTPTVVPSDRKSSALDMDPPR
jgi:hypothetical protein